MFAAIDERDMLLHHPYESYDPVVALLAQAADDPDVLAIKQTLYRASPSSAIIDSLQRAAERNKQVTVVVELTARFDEERNIRWARALEEAGAHVIYGIRGYKVHAKICQIVKRTPFGLRRYVHLAPATTTSAPRGSTRTSACSRRRRPIAEDASAFFSALTGYSDPPRLKKLTMAPTGLRERFLRLINRERRRAEAGQPAEIMAKMNSLIDDEIIEALYAASREGVVIRLNVRGICALRPRRARPQRDHRGRLGRRSFSRALAHLLVPERRRGRNLPRQRRLDDAQLRQADRAALSGRTPRAQGQGDCTRCGRCSATTSRRGS